jgi:hypothetical protein
MASNPAIALWLSLGRPNMRRFFLIAIVVAVALGALAYWYRIGSRFHVPAGPAVSINVFVSRRPLATITNADGLAAVMGMLRSGRPAKPHECAARGTMEARFADGRTLAVAFGPGHEESGYEFGVDGHLFTVSRSRFLESLKTGGADVQQIPTE